jgi:hypothetical protein
VEANAAAVCQSAAKHFGHKWSNTKPVGDAKPEEMQSLKGMQHLKEVQSLKGVQHLKEMQHLKEVQSLKEMQNLKGMQHLKEMQSLWE